MNNRQHPLYRKWTHIRCCQTSERYRQQNHVLDNTVEWTDFKSFVEDIESYLGPCPGPEYVLHRLDTTKGWTLKNLTWSTRKRVGRDQRNIIYLRYRGKTKCLSEWCEELNLSWWVARRRLSKGLPTRSVLKT